MQIDVAKKKDGNQTVTPFSFYIYFLGSNIIMCKVRFNIGDRGRKTTMQQQQLI